MKTPCCWGAVTCGIVLSASIASGQIVPDRTLPSASSVTGQGSSVLVIEGGTAVGTNLFHSFSQFNIPTGLTGYFNNSVGITNIFSRVTGGGGSTIDGILKANGTANLFLLNPNGIIFGNNARLNIGGDFLATTANSILFADGTEFSAKVNDTGAKPLLTINVPIGLQYGNDTSAAAGISVNGSTLVVNPGNTLALVGGDVTINGGSALASSGRIELMGVGGAGTVGLSLVNNQFRLNNPPTQSLADVSLVSGTLVSTSGVSGGTVQIYGRQIQVVDSTVEANTTDSGNTEGGERGGVNAFATDSIDVVSDNNNGGGGGTFSTGFFAENRGSGSGSGNNLTITTQDLQVVGDARISTGNFGEGRGGDLTINASGTVRLSGTDPTNDVTLFTGLLTDTYSGGAGGNLTVHAGQLIVQDGAQISAATFGAGNGGNLNVMVGGGVQLLGVSPSDLLSSGLFTAVQPGATGNAGDLTVSAREITVTNGAQIFTGTAGVGNGGNINVIATDSITVTGVSPIAHFASSITSATNPGNVGSAGDLSLKTGQLIVSDGAQISAATEGLNKVGSLTVEANSIQLSGSALEPDPFNPSQFLLLPSGLFAKVANANNLKNAGDLNINVAGELAILGGAQLGVTNQGHGNGGNINVVAGSLVLDNKESPATTLPGGIQAFTNSGNGGNINLNVASGVLLLRHGSRIVTDATGGTGNGGNITINTPISTLLENSDIAAKAIAGRGGNINITTQGLFSSRDSDINASSQIGVNGQININTPAIDPAKGLVVLPTRVFSIEGLIVQRCSNGARLASRFTVTGRGGLPVSPDEGFESETILSDWGTAGTPQAGAINPNLLSDIPYSNAAPPNPPAQLPAPLVEARGWELNSRGEVVLTPNPPELQSYSATSNLPISTCSTSIPPN